ncbi:MAG TPA: response regulator transcription factor [Candidatus Protoclostridium stercorigallinarum]|uniref:Stage 0 sporulation protein A homolog n=1 Tax=Candidatus Protoclostridium stercorigallinarum TaxID=2838741 RepID=A0A9D1Q132_9FIRM|nr:response regulator transcription factor [Candidatus Protoclostridium stercorigallinarum]
MRVLLVEDSVSLTEALESVFKREKFVVDIAHDGEEGVAYAETGVYDVIIMDVMMPVKSGVEATKELRAKKINTPIIMLTALSEESDKIAGLDCGADDYITKPFSVSELLARIRAVTRRKGDIIPDDGLSYGGVTLNLYTYMLSSGDKSIKLSKKEAEIMRYFFEKPSFVAQRDQIISKVWGFDSEFESNNLEVFISFLRKKLRFLDARFTIMPVRGVGYRLSEPEKA